MEQGINYVDDVDDENNRGKETICGKFCNRMQELTTETKYILAVSVAALLSLILRMLGAVAGGSIPTLNSGGCTKSWCTGNQAVYRLSLAMVIAFLLFLIVEPLASSIRAGKWRAKAATFVVCLIICFALSNDAFLGFPDAARFFSFFFLIIQGIINLEVCNVIHNALLEASARSQRSRHDRSVCSDRYRMAYLVTAVLTNVCSLSLCAYMLSVADFDCAQSVVFIVFTILTVIVSIGVSMTSLGRGLIVSGGATMYASWLCFSAIKSEPNAECNWFAEHQAEDPVSFLSSMVLAGVCIGFSSTAEDLKYDSYVESTGLRMLVYRVSAALCGDQVARVRSLDPRRRQRRAIKNDDLRVGLAEGIAAIDDGDDEYDAKNEGDDARRTGNDYADVDDVSDDDEDGDQGTVVVVTRDTARSASLGTAFASECSRRFSDARSGILFAASAYKSPTGRKVVAFHFAMICASFYIAMASTNWETLPENDEDEQRFASSSVYTKIIAQWCFVVIYLLSLSIRRCEKTVSLDGPTPLPADLIDYEDVDRQQERGAIALGGI